jgi:hypothetical protein
LEREKLLAKHDGASIADDAKEKSCEMSAGNAVKQKQRQGK